MAIGIKGQWITLVGLSLLAACSGPPEGNETQDASGDNEAGNVFGAPRLGNAANGAEAVLIPPAPGEPGGLPDDRRPLDEGAMKDPASVAASGATIEMWGFALADGRYGDAWRFWADGGKQSGMTEEQFVADYRRYSEIHVLVGRPEAGGTQTARVPVQMYGRRRDSGKPFNLYGMMTLARNPRGQNGEAGQMPWLIAHSELEPMGEVKLSRAQGDAPAHIIPAGFQGEWSQAAADCGKPGDMTRLTVRADALLFYESQAKVTDISFTRPDDIRISADYEGEGERWTRASRLLLSKDGKTLTLDGFRRVRCA